MSTHILNTGKIPIKTDIYLQLRFSSYLKYLYIQFYRNYWSFITTKDKEVDFEIILM